MKEELAKFFKGFSEEKKASSNIYLYYDVILKSGL